MHSVGSANNPTQIPPSSPATACVWNTPSVSSTCCNSHHRLCSHIMVHHGMLPARIPITNAAQSGTNPTPRPQPFPSIPSDTIPWNLVEAKTLPKQNASQYYGTMDFNLHTRSMNGGREMEFVKRFVDLPAAGVMATRPVIMPCTAPMADGFPKKNTSKVVHVKRLAEAQT